MLEKILGISAALAETTGTTGAGEEAVAANPVAALVTTFVPMILIFVVFFWIHILNYLKRFLISYILIYLFIK